MPYRLPRQCLSILVSDGFFFPFVNTGRLEGRLRGTFNCNFACRKVALRTYLIAKLTIVNCNVALEQLGG